MCYVFWRYRKIFKYAQVEKELRVEAEHEDRILQNYFGNIIALTNISWSKNQNGFVGANKFVINVAISRVTRVEK